MSPRLKLHPGMTNTNKGFLSFNTTFHHSSIIAENLRYFCFSLSHSNTSETLLCTIPPTNLFAFHSAFPSRINLFQTEQSVFTELNTQKSGRPPSWLPSQSFWSQDMSVHVISPNFVNVLYARHGAHWYWRMYICRCSHSQSEYPPPLMLLHMPRQTLICKWSMGGMRALWWKSCLRAKCEVDNQANDFRLGSGLTDTAAAEATETPCWEERWRSEGWVVKQIHAGPKKAHHSQSGISC